MMAVSSHTAIPQSVSNSALGALSILPPQFQGYVVKLSADNGNPNPPEWYVLAYRGSPEAGLFSITIADGEIVQAEAISQSRRVVQESKSYRRGKDRHRFPNRL